MKMLSAGRNRWWMLVVLVVQALAWLAPAQMVLAQERLRPPSVIHPELDQVGRSIARERCRKPLKVHRERVPSAANARVMDAVHTTTCAGFEVVLFQPAAARRGAASLPMGVTVTEGHPLVPPALAVGTTATAVRERLGPPYETQGANLVYAVSNARPDDDFVIFHVEQGKVAAIEWSWNTD